MRELIDAVPAEDSADGGDPGVLAHLEQHAAGALVDGQQVLELSVRPVDHRAELQHRKGLSVGADAFRRVEDGALAGQFDGDGSGDEHRCCGDQRRQREHEVEGLLLKAVRPFVLRLVDMQQRQPAGQAQGQPSLGDVHDAGRHHQVDVAGLQLPQQFPDPVHPKVIRLGHRDGVRAAAADRRRHLGLVAQDRDLAAADRQGVAARRPVTGDADADHDAPGHRVTVQFVCEVRDRLPVSDRQDAGLALALDALVADVLSPHAAAGQQSHGADGKRDRQIAAGQIDLGEQRHHGDDPERPEGCGADPAVLLDPRADDSR